MRRVALSLAVLCALALPRFACASTSEFAISVGDSLPATFVVPIHADYAGTLAIETTWSGNRLLFFSVSEERTGPLTHRSGPSPQRLEIPVDAARLADGARYTLTIKALPARGALSGTVRVTLPDSPEVVAEREARLHPPPPPPPPPPEWTLAKTAPPGSAPAVAGLFATVEGYRRMALAEDARPDGCGWQEPFLRYAAALRDRVGAAGKIPDEPSRLYYARLAAAVRVVEGLRNSKDPILAGPPPADRDLRQEWNIARAEKVRPIERKLYQLGELLHGGHAPALEDQAWIPRFIACLTACERAIDETVRLARDQDAQPTGREVLQSEWAPILAAVRVFESIASLGPEPAVTP